MRDREGNQLRHVIGVEFHHPGSKCFPKARAALDDEQNFFSLFHLPLPTVNALDVRHERNTSGQPFLNQEACNRFCLHY